MKEDKKSPSYIRPESSSPQTTSEPNQEIDKSFWFKFLGGFIGWYLVFGVIWLVIVSDWFSDWPPYGLDMEFMGLFNLLLFPLNLVILIIQVKIRKTRPIGYGILCALAVNFVFAIFMGALSQGACLVPFFIPHY